MDIKKIEKLEGEVKDLHLKPKQKNHSATKQDVTETFRLFWTLHLKPVIDCSKELAKKYNANLEIVWLSAIFHDIARLEDLEPHDEISSERAYNILLDKGFSKEIATEVKKTILTHRCRNYKPETLEQKILATADAMNHFNSPFYLWFSWISTKSFKEQLESGLKKLERDYNEKIFFEEERGSVKNEYEILKNWFNYHLKL